MPAAAAGGCAPDTPRAACRSQKVETYEYEMPSDFEDEEIDEDLAFTAEDKAKYAGWFGDGDEQAAAEEQHQQQRKRAKRAPSEFADLDSSSEEEPASQGVHEDEVRGQQQRWRRPGCGCSSGGMGQSLPAADLLNTLAVSPAFARALHTG